MNALSDPSSEVAQSILSSEEIVDEITEPWWDDSFEINDRFAAKQSRKRSGAKPKLFEIPSAALNAAALSAASGPSLLNNIFAVL